MTRTVAIVGGGASGVITAVALAREWRSPVPLRVVLYDAAPAIGRGVAYSTDDERHLLNVPAKKMSAVADDEHHFVRWLRRTDPHATPEQFRPRAEYGAYLAETLEEHRHAVSLVVRRSQVTDLLRVPDGFIVSHVTGTDHAHAVVLALGNPPPAPLTVGGALVPNGPRHISDPWAPGALARVRELVDSDSTVLLVGTGLTAVDVALSFGASRPGPRLVAVSRRGWLPRSHVVPGPQPWPVDPPRGDTPLTLARVEAFVRLEVERARRNGADWRAVVDGMRPHLSSLWARMPERERAAFLNGPVRSWEVHRHRMAPAVASSIVGLLEQGRLDVVAGALSALTERRDGWSVRVESRRRTHRLRPDVVINCTGPSADTSRCRGPLVAALARRGLVGPDPLRLGLDTTPTGELRGRHGLPDPALLAVGPPRKGALWESTAVPEIRQQAVQVARSLASRLVGEVAGDLREPAVADGLSTILR